MLPIRLHVTEALLGRLGRRRFVVMKLLFRDVYSLNLDSDCLVVVQLRLNFRYSRHSIWFGTTARMTDYHCCQQPCEVILCDNLDYRVPYSEQKAEYFSRPTSTCLSI